MSSIDAQLTELSLKIANLLDSKYTAYLGDRFFSVHYEINKDYGNITITLATFDKEFYYPIDGYIDIKKHNLSGEEALILLSDYIDSYLENYFQSEGDVLLPIDWAEFKHQDFTLYLRGQILNKKLENLADQILAQADCQDISKN